MEWTLRKIIIALAMQDGGSSKNRYEVYQQLVALKEEEDWFTLDELHPLLTAEQYDWLSQTDFSLLEEQYRIQGIHFLTIEDEEYPQRLKEIYLPPVVLFYQGNLRLLQQQCLAVVGSRQHTEYSKRALQLWLPEVVHHQLVIVSGLAKGVDAQSHETALKAHGKTIAVIGTGLDLYYPKENAALQKQIAERGLVLSEYPIGSEPLKFHFPYRNRIIAGISHGVCVVEARMKSGSLITANVALSENRTVFAVPGDITSLYSKGTNSLIASGAIPLTQASDVLENLSYFD